MGWEGECNTLERRKMHTKFWAENAKKTKTLKKTCGWMDGIMLS
jgi:hypothetical protein